MCENHDGLSHRSVSEQRRLHSPSVDEQETELEPSLEQDEEDRDQEQGQNTEQDRDHDGNVTPSKKKEIMVVKLSWQTLYELPLWRSLFSNVRIMEGPNVQSFSQLEDNPGLGAGRWHRLQVLMYVGAVRASQADPAGA